MTQPLAGRGSLAGLRALVTGGSRGIGAAIVQRLTADGAACGIVCRDPDVLAADDDEALRSAVAVAGDVGDTASIRTAVDAVADRLGGLDIVVNNAGRVAGSAPDTVLDVADDLLARDFAEKVIGARATVVAALPHLRDSHNARVVNIGGESARVAAHNVSSGARNAALVHLTHAMAMELGPEGVTVNIVHPGVVRTEGLPAALARAAARRGTTVEDLMDRLAGRTAMRRLTEPEDVAAVVAFLCSPDARAVTAQVIAVSGGSSNAVHA